MSILTHYTRFLFFFIIYVGINLLIIKIRSSDYIYNNVLNILKNPKSIPQTHNVNNINYVSIMQKKEILDISNASIFKKQAEIFSIDLKDTQTTLKQIFETCKENNITTSIIKRNFLYSSEHSSLYCWIRKAGSTSFTKIFSDLNNRKFIQNYYREIDFLTPKTEKSLKILLNDAKTFKFLIVRHPFERLVSAYRDRIEDNSKYTAQSWIYAPKIFHLTRPELFKSSGTVDESLTKIFYEDNRLKLIPTFEEFIKWLLLQDSATDDPHWNQYYKHCALCTVQYDFILKLDNYTDSDVKYIYSKMNFNENKINLPKLEQTKDGPTNFDQTCNYFKNLSHAAVVNLYEKYKIDFDMFNYEFDKYFECIEGD